MLHLLSPHFVFKAGVFYVTLQGSGDTPAPCPPCHPDMPTEGWLEVSLCDKVNTSESTPYPGAATPHVSSGRGWTCGAELCAHGGAPGEKLPCLAAHVHHALRRIPFQKPPTRGPQIPGCWTGPY